MEQVLKIKVLNTEYAAVEIIPTEDGVEIVIKRKDKEKPVVKPNADNHAILKEFCKEKKEYHKNDKTMIKELVAFFNFYEQKIEDGWKGTMMPEKLWKQWIKTMGK